MLAEKNSRETNNAIQKHQVSIRDLILISLTLALMLSCLSFTHFTPSTNHSIQRIRRLPEDSRESIIKTIPNNPVTVTPKTILIQDVEKISRTGLNSSKVKIIYNPTTDSLGLSWVDIFRPFTPSAVSSLHFKAGSLEKGWSDRLDLETILSTVTHKPQIALDSNNEMHYIFEEYVNDNFELRDTIIANETTLKTSLSITNNSGNSTNPMIAVDQQEVIHLVWLDTTTSSSGDIYYSSFDSTIDSWSPEEIITSGAVVNTSFSSPAFTIDTENTLHLIWADQRDGKFELYYAYKPPTGSWMIEKVTTSAIYQPICPSITFEPQSNKLQVIYRDNNTTGNLFFISKEVGNDTHWSSPTVIATNLAKEADYEIIADQYGNSLIVCELMAGSYSSIYLLEKNEEETTWSNPEVISSLQVPAQDPSITMDSNGTIFIAYSELYAGSTYEIFLAKGIIDSDNDQLSDREENLIGTDPFDPDSDNDGLEDGEEVLNFGTDPLNIDSDSDQLPDKYELENNFDPLDPSDANTDLDGDGLTNIQEYSEGTNPRNSDSDGDSLEDGEEINLYNTNPLNSDTDQDQLYDNYELRWGLDPLVANDINADPDQDGLTTEFESLIWTDPTNPDTDGDGWNDGVEVANDTDPLDPEDFPQVQTQRDYTRLIIAIVIGVIFTFICLAFVVLFARQFRPKESRKRKDLEREQKQLASAIPMFGMEGQEERTVQTHVPTTPTKRQASTIKRREQEEEEEEVLDITKIEEIQSKKKRIAAPKRKRRDEQEEEVPSEGLEEPSPRIKDETKITDQLKETTKKEPIKDEVLRRKEEQMKQHISALKEYHQKILALKNDKMTSQTIAQASREQLTEYASESQALYSEAQAIWDSSILPLIKGYEKELELQTLSAEKILENCKEIANQILDLLVQRELKYSETEGKE
ncbi:MAG: hypothetical protein GF308_18570 [Candidatus Heimdallarchaeota archaeon]|nr:hypothetical protein [Candidatus Heimdallarchaeota archaeon]